MIFGLNDDLKRIRASKELSARCEICNEVLIPACGDIYSHHWRHVKSTDCDPWKENETEWHRNWKKQFPEDWLEIVIKYNLEIHRADIKTEAGLVLELQNSSISNKDIQKRELFYGKMIWLINAQNFEQNFSIRSIVNHNLRSLDEKTHLQLNQNYEIEEELDSYYQFRDKQIEKLRDFKLELASLEKKEKAFIEGSESIDKHAIELCKNFDNCFSINSQTSEIFNEFKCENLISIQKTSKRLTEIKNRVDEINKKISQINELPDCSIDSLSHFKIVHFSQVHPSNYVKCKVIKIESINTLFPVIHDLNSESNFIWYSKQENTYTLVINLSNNLLSLISQKDQLEAEENSLVILKNNEYDSLLNLMKNYIDKKIFEMRSKISDLRIGIENKTIERKVCEEEIEEERERLRNESIENEKKIMDEKEKHRLSIMKDFKGLYFYYWKYRRQSWNGAKAPIFFDFGGHIFQIIDDHKMRKISIIEFIKFVNNWRNIEN
jgi:hypothetical protein